MNRREQVLATANTLVNGDRNEQYGDPKDDFGCTAQMMTAYLDRVYQRRGTRELQPHDVAVFQILVKISRLAETPDKLDSWVDILGYGACGADCVLPMDEVKSTG